MIPTTVPSSIRRPGVYPEFKFVDDPLSLIPISNRVVIVAEKTAAGTAPIELPIQVFGAADADTKAGPRSLGAVLARTAFAQGALSEATPEIWICPVAEPSGGAATQWTITVVVTTATGGTLVLTVAGRLVIVGVNAGDSASAIAAGIKAALDALLTIPFTATVAGAVVTLVHTTKGQNGNDAAFAIVQSSTSPNGVTCNFAQTVPGTGATTITNALQALYDQRYHAIAISNHTVADLPVLVLERLAAWNFAQKNYRWFFVGCRDSLGTAQTLQALANDLGIVIGSYEQTPSLPGEIAVVDAVAEFSRDAPNANLNGERVALYPVSGAFAYTGPEIESGLNGGLLVHEPDAPFSKITRFITSVTTLNGVQTETVRDIAYPRTSAFLAEQVVIRYQAEFKQQTDSIETRTRVRDMIVQVMRVMEGLGYLLDVDTFLDKIQVEKSNSPAGRYVASAPHRVGGPVGQLVLELTMFL